MKKSLLTLSLLFLCFLVYSQADTSKHLFAPGTLVGKYYGTYDTTTQKDNPADSTRILSGIQTTSTIAGQKQNSNQLSAQGNIRSNVIPDPIDYSGTTHVSGLESQSQLGNSNLSTSGISAEVAPQLKSTLDPIESSGTNLSSQIDINQRQGSRTLETGGISANKELQKNIQVAVVPKAVPGEPYHLYKLGSSTEMYNTYSKNKNGRGAITTSTNKNTDIGQTPSVNPEFSMTPSVRARERLNLLFGSSEPFDATYQSNDDNAGLITTSVNKENLMNTMPQNDPSGKSRRDARAVLGLRLGSSTPAAATFEENNNGHGKITSTNKTGVAMQQNSGIVPQIEQPQSLKAREKLNLELGSSEPYDSTYQANDDDAGLITTSPDKNIFENDEMQQHQPIQQQNTKGKN